MDNFLRTLYEYMGQSAKSQPQAPMGPPAPTAAQRQYGNVQMPPDQQYSESPTHGFEPTVGQPQGGAAPSAIQPTDFAAGPIAGAVRTGVADVAASVPASRLGVRASQAVRAYNAPDDMAQLFRILGREVSEGGREAFGGRVKSEALPETVNAYEELAKKIEGINVPERAKRALEAFKKDYLWEKPSWETFDPKNARAVTVEKLPNPAAVADPAGTIEVAAPARDNGTVKLTPSASPKYAPGEAYAQRPDGLSHEQVVEKQKLMNEKALIELLAKMKDGK